MKYLSMIALGISLACNSSQQTISRPAQGPATEVSPVAYASGITAEELKSHLYTYASDEFEGRETGTPGHKKAVEYLKDQYEEMRVPPAQKNGDYFQEVPLQMAKLPTGSVTVNGKTYQIGVDFLAFSPAGFSFEEMVYAGYGIDSDAYSDYGNLDVEGKLVLIKAGEPMNEDGTYAITGSARASAWSNVSESIEKKTDAARRHGVKGILYYDTDNYARYRRYYEYMKTNSSGSMGIRDDDSIPPLILIDHQMAEIFYPEIAQAQKPKTIRATIQIALESSNEIIDSENVIAYIEGTDKADEYLVISSHLDHIGITADGEINNGADDDGSGTVAMLEIAEAFGLAKKEGHGPRRSVVFLHVTGEEKGLLGSQYYTDVAPVFPLSQTVTNLNIDMIGRTDPKRDGSDKYIYLIGSDKLSSDLHRISESVNARYLQLQLDYTYNDENDPNRFYYRSDHYNFAKNNIPIIFYFNGTHDDYHRPSDTPDKINYGLLEQRTRLIFHTAWELANREKRVEVDKVAR